MTYTIPATPISCGALLRDADGNVLVLKPSYKKGWTLPGGQMEDTGETPWECCRREVLEETGISLDEGRLVVVDTRPAKEDRQLGVRFLFDGGTLTKKQVDGIRLQRGEITEHAFVPEREALSMLRPAVARRVEIALGTKHCRYVEDGRPVDGVS